MSEKIVISKKPVTGGYSFSASNETITLSSSVSEFSEMEYNNLVEEARIARQLYVQGVAEAKANNTKESPVSIKAKAVASAKAQLQPNAPTKPAPTAPSVAKAAPKAPPRSTEMRDPMLDILDIDDSIVMDNPFVPEDNEPDIHNKAVEEVIDFGEFDSENPFD